MNYIEEVIRNLPEGFPLSHARRPIPFCMVQRRDTLAVFLFAQGGRRPVALIKSDIKDGAIMREREAFAFFQRTNFRVNGYDGQPVYLVNLVKPALVFPLERLEPYMIRPFSAARFRRDLDDMSLTERSLQRLPHAGCPDPDSGGFLGFLKSPRIADKAVREELRRLMEWRDERRGRGELLGIQQGDGGVETLYRSDGSLARLHWENASPEIFLSDWATFVCTYLAADFSGRKAKKRFEHIEKRLSGSRAVRGAFEDATARLMNELGVPEGDRRDMIRWSFLRFLFHEAPRYPEIIEQRERLWRT